MEPTAFKITSDKMIFLLTKECTVEINPKVTKKELSGTLCKIGGFLLVLGIHEKFRIL